MPSTEVNHLVCAGTKRISINQGEHSSAAEGTLSVYARLINNKGSSDGGRRSPATARLSGGGNENGLHVMITDGAHTYYEW